VRVLVTGGSGFLGANVVRKLLERGDSVRALVRGTSPGLALDGLAIERVVCGLDDRRGLGEACRGMDAVLHVAGLYDPGPGGEDAMYAVHVTGTKNLLEAAGEARVPRAVVCSSSITVGFGPRDRPGDEETALNPNVYGARGPLRTYYETKLASEALARKASEDGLPTSIVNPDYVLGAWDLKPTSGASIVWIAKAPIPVHPRGG
jgi:nucleoside-diphosphate-sugar epimerase